MKTLPPTLGFLARCYRLMILFTGLTLTGCSNQPVANQDEKPSSQTEDEEVLTLNSKQAQNAGLVLDTLRFLPLNREILLSGQVEAPPQNLISVSMPMAGQLRTTHLLPGMKVQKGEILAYMEDPAYLRLQENYWSTRIKVENLGAELQRQEELLRNGSGNPKTERDLRSEWRTAKVQTKALEEQLRLLGLEINQLNETQMIRQIPVRSPVQGYVTEVHHSTGQYINAGETLYELVDPSDVHLRLNVFEKDLPYLQENQKLYAYTNHQPKVEHPAHILLIGKEFAADRSVEVHCHFDRYDNKLIPGMYMRARLNVPTEALPAIPVAGVQYHQGQAYVFERVWNFKNPSSDLQFWRRPVRVVHRDKDWVWLEFQKTEDGPLQARSFVTQGSYNLLMLSFNKADED
ncbi:MAG: efflux RND transporter periplasmic adaptor subunit [Bacteroidia bacterium]